jgi:peptide/nickel transport system substrate-binding protein
MMKEEIMKKALWLAATLLIIVSLVLASCASPGTGTTTTASPSKTTSGGGTPKYGGTITTTGGFGYNSFDLMKQWDIFIGHVQWTHNEPMGGDFSKGPQGTHETNWDYGFVGNTKLLSAELAESWTLPDATTIIWHLRKGVHWAKNPKAEKNALVNGREMVADDWVWSLKQAFDVPTSWQAGQYPAGDPRRPTSFKATDKYTVEVKVPADSQGLMLLEMGGNNHIKCPELWTTGGDNTNWKNIIGTGPWILDDFVDGSSITYVKNPDYWDTDPLHKGNKVPYADKVSLLVINDISTQLSALRTAKIDYIGFGGVRSEDAKTLLSQNKNLLSYKRINGPWVLSGRQDKAPFSDLKVRRALNLAVDKQAILKDYYKGDAELMAYPYPPGPDWSKYYTPLNQLPPDTQELFTGYNVEKAKQLLKDAGYPTGFKAEVIVTSQQPRPDEVSLLAGYLSKIGVILDIKVVEPGMYSSIDVKNETKDMYYGEAKGVWAPFEQLMVKKNTGANDAIIDDPYYDEVGKVIGRDMVGNPDNFFKVMKESGVHELSSAWAIFMPSPYAYNVWWPWLKNYDGITWTGWADINDWVEYLWIDQDLKKSLGY